MISLLRLMLLTAFMVIVTVLPLAASALVDVNGDFSFETTINGEDVSQSETFIMDPEESLDILFHIDNVSRKVTLEKLSIIVMFAGQDITIIDRDISQTVDVGEIYDESITISPGEALKLGDITLITGIYPLRISL